MMSYIPNLRDTGAGKQHLYFSTIINKWGYRVSSMQITHHNKISLSLFLMLTLLLSVSVYAAEKASVRSKTPITMTVKKAQSLSVIGTTVHNAKSVSILSAKKQVIKDMTVTFACKAPTRKGAKGSCDVKLTITKAVPLGKYTLNLIGTRKQTLATGEFEVKADPAVAKAAAKKKVAAATAKRKALLAKQVADKKKTPTTTKPVVTAKPASAAVPNRKAAVPAIPAKKVIPKKTATTKSIEKQTAVATKDKLASLKSATKAKTPIPIKPTTLAKPATKPATSKPATATKPKAVTPKNQEPLVTTISLPKDIKPGQKFTATITATDDAGVVAVAIKFGKKRQTLRAKSPFKKQDTFTVELTAQKSGAQELTAIALDTKRARSAIKKAAIELAQQVATVPTTKPIAKPTVKPIAKPTVKPIAKPTVKPIAKPTVPPIAAKPSSIIETTPSTVTYAWSNPVWAACSATCGDGTQTRIVRCRGSDGSIAADKQCSGTKPASSQVCNTKACPASEQESTEGTSTSTTGAGGTISTGSVTTTASDNTTDTLDTATETTTGTAVQEQTQSSSTVPALLSPASNADIAAGITLTWLEINEADFYVLCIDRAPDTSATTCDALQNRNVIGNSTSFTIDIKLFNQLNTTYSGSGNTDSNGNRNFTWQVRGCNQSGQCQDSERRSIKIPAAQLSRFEVITPPSMAAYVLHEQGNDFQLAARYRAGEPITLGIGLDNPAPAGGLEVALSVSGDLYNIIPNNLPFLPTTITIPAGNTSLQFEIQTRWYAGNRVTTYDTVAPVILGAEFQGTRLTNTVNFEPRGGVMSLDTYLGSIQHPNTSQGGTNSPYSGGESFSASISLSHPAPEGGAVISLSTDKPETLVLPSSVTIPSSQSAASFDVQTVPVSTYIGAKIIATYDGVTTGETTKETLIKVNVAPIQSLTFSNTGFVGGESVIGTITIDGQVPRGGAVITLENGSQDIATFPNSVTIPQGQTSVNFTINTQAVTSNSWVDVKAKYGTSAWASGLFPNEKDSGVWINPLPQLSSIHRSPNVFEPGDTLQGTVVLTNDAPETGATVTLSSDKLQASVPANVSIPGGEDRATFNINTQAVTETTFAHVTASYGGTTKKLGIAISPLLSQILFYPVPDIVAGGESFQAKVVLQRYQDTPTMVQLNSNSSKVTVPQSVTIPAGQGNALFTITTQSVTNQATANITGTLQGVSKSKKLTLITQQEAQALADAAAEVAAPPVLTGFSITPSDFTITSGSTSIGTLTLNKNTNSNFTVTISKTGGINVEVPSNVTIPAGQSEATFEIITVANSNDDSVVFTVSQGDISLERAISINPAPWLLNDIRLQVKTTESGRGLTGTVSTDRPTNKDGDVVTLSSSNSEILPVPGSIIIPPSSNNGTFDLRPNDVSEVTYVIITATLDGISKTTELEITPTSQ